MTPTSWKRSASVPASFSTSSFAAELQGDIEPSASDAHALQPAPVMERTVVVEDKRGGHRQAIVCWRRMSCDALSRVVPTSRRGRAIQSRWCSTGCGKTTIWAPSFVCATPSWLNVFCGAPVMLRKRKLVQAAAGTQRWVPWEEASDAVAVVRAAKAAGHWIAAVELTASVCICLATTISSRARSGW